MIDGMIPDQIDHRRPCSLGIVEIGKAVAQTGAQMEQGRGGLFRHPAVAIGSTSDNTFKQTQNGAHIRLLVDRGNQLHLRCSGVGETNFYTTVPERFN